MTNAKFIKLLKELDSLRPLDQGIANQTIKKYFPNFGDDTKLKNYFRAIVKERISLVPKKDIETVLKLLNTIYPKLNPNTRTLDAAYSLDVRNPLSEKWGKESEIHKLSKKLLKILWKGELA